MLLVLLMINVILFIKSLKELASVKTVCMNIAGGVPKLAPDPSMQPWYAESMEY